MEEISIYEDVYDQLVEMIDPHVKVNVHGRSSCSEDSLTMSVVGSVDYLLEFWLLNRNTPEVEHP
jgi:hypothetical protein